MHVDVVHLAVLLLLRIGERAPSGPELLADLAEAKICRNAIVNTQCITHAASRPCSATSRVNSIDIRSPITRGVGDYPGSRT